MATVSPGPPVPVVTVVPIVAVVSVPVPVMPAVPVAPRTVATPAGALRKTASAAARVGNCERRTHTGCDQARQNNVGRSSDAHRESHPPPPLNPVALVCWTHRQFSHNRPSKIC